MTANPVAINRPPQSLTTQPCPICRKPARVVGRVGAAANGRQRVLMSCVPCKWTGEFEIDAPEGDIA